MRMIRCICSLCYIENDGCVINSLPFARWTSSFLQFRIISSRYSMYFVQLLFEYLNVQTTDNSVFLFHAIFEMYRVLPHRFDEFRKKLHIWKTWNMSDEHRLEISINIFCFVIIMKCNWKPFKPIDSSQRDSKWFFSLLKTLIVNILNLTK